MIFASSSTQHCGADSNADLVTVCLNASGFFCSAMKNDEKPLGGNNPLKLQRILCCWQAAVSPVLLDTVIAIKYTT